jgi:hypothetical protein
VKHMRFSYRGREAYLVSLYTQQGGVFVFWSLDREMRGRGRLVDNSFSGVIPIEDFLRLTRPYCRPGIHYETFPPRNWRRPLRRTETK